MMSEQMQGESTERRTERGVDPLYLELIEHRVLRGVRSTFWTAFGVLLVVTAGGVGYLQYYIGGELGEVIRQVERDTRVLSRVAAAVGQERKRDQDYAELFQKTGEPVVVGIETRYERPGRLVVVGSGFGPEAGHIDLYYEKRSVAGVRSTVVRIEEGEIQEWTDRRISANTTVEQREAITESLQVEDFEDLIPYITVMTRSGRQSALW